MNPNDITYQIELRDIHLPDTLLWWPLAPGWWLLIAVLIMTVLLLLYRQRRLWQASLRVLAANELTRILDHRELSPSQVFIRLYWLLRRITRALPGGDAMLQAPAGEWLDWLAEITGTQASSSLKTQAASIPFQPPRDDIDCSDMQVFTRAVIEHLPNLQRPLPVLETT